MTTSIITEKTMSNKTIHDSDQSSDIENSINKKENGVKEKEEILQSSNIPYEPEPQILLSMNCRDERNIKEWVDHHLAIGFDHILLMDDQSKSEYSPNSFLFEPCKWSTFSTEEHNENVKRYKKSVTVRKLNKNKLGYMGEALQFCKEHDIEFMIHLDADEYICIQEVDEVHKKRRSIKDFLTKICVLHPNLCSLMIPWVMFGSSHHDKVPHPTQFLPYYTLCEGIGEGHVKSIIRVNSVAHPESPHHWKFRHDYHLSHRKSEPKLDFRDMSKMMELHSQWKKRRGGGVNNKKDSSSNHPCRNFCPSGLPVTCSVLSSTGYKLALNRPSYSSFRDHKVADFPVFIGHFVNQSWDEFCRRRSRPRDDTRLVRTYEFPLDSSEKGSEVFHAKYNQVPFDGFCV